MGTKEYSSRKRHTHHRWPGKLHLISRDDVPSAKVLLTEILSASTPRGRSWYVERQPIGGRIILITTSDVATLTPGYAAYAASKVAVETMTKIVAKELKGTRFTANCVAPGPIATDMFFVGKSEELIKRMVDACPMGRLGEPKDVTQLVGFLSTARSSGSLVGLVLDLSYRSHSLSPL